MTTQIRQKLVSALMTGAALICFVGFAKNVNAQCGTQTRAATSALSLASANKMAAAMRPPMPEANLAQSAQEAEPDIVGLWDQRFIVGGQLYDEAFDQFHADGNEVAIDIVPPIAGNVCLGIWKKGRGARTYNVMHPFWVFDPATNTVVIGKGLITETITINKTGDKFAGTFKITFRDLNGLPMPAFADADGELTGDRIDL
jgi:hypothetical protein